MAVTPLARLQSSSQFATLSLSPPLPHHSGAVAPPRGDRIELSHEPSVKVDSSQRGFGVGLMAGASAEAGAVAGVGATASAGAGLFYDSNRGVHPGSFASAGAFAGIGNHGRSSPRSPEPVGAIGAFAGAGIGAFVTNATAAKQLDGIAQTYSLNVGIGPLKVSVQVGSADGTYVGSVSVGPGIGLDVSRYPTQSVTSPR